SGRGGVRAHDHHDGKERGDDAGSDRARRGETERHVALRRPEARERPRRIREARATRDLRGERERDDRHDPAEPLDEPAIRRTADGRAPFDERNREREREGETEREQSPSGAEARAREIDAEQERSLEARRGWGVERDRR